MSLTALAAGLTVKVKDSATAGLKRIGAGFGRLQKRGVQLKKGLGLAAQGLRQFALAGTVVAAGLVAMSKKAADFEQQMSIVRSVTDPAEAGSPKWGAMEKEVKRLGATTQFTAIQVGQGAENLKRAGFSLDEARVSLSSGLNLAAADGIEIAQAMDIAASALRGFGLDAEDMGRVTDVLAVTSASTNTNVLSLGEGLKFVAPIARQLGVSIEDASLSLGLLANAGIKGTSGGTALKNMLLKLATASDGTKKKFKDLGIEIQDANGNMLPFRSILKGLSEGLPKLGGNLEQTKFLAQAFGIRGQAAASNLASAFVKMGKDVDEHGINKFDALVNKIQNADGAAKRMADIRLDNLTGAFTLLGSAIEGLAIEAFTSSLSPAKRIVQSLADRLGVVVLAMQGFNDEVDSPALIELRKKLGPVADDLAEFGRGLKDGIALLARANRELSKFGARFSSVFSPDSDGMRGFGQFIAIAVPVVAVLSVLAVAAGVVAVPFILLGEAALVVAGALGVFAIAGVGALGLFGLALASSRDEGQSFGSKLTEVFGGLKKFVVDFAQGASDGFDKWLKPAFVDAQDAGKELLEAFKPIFTALEPLFGSVGLEASTMGGVFIAVFGSIVKVAAWMMSNLATVVKFLVDSVFAPIITGFANVWIGLKDLVTGTGGRVNALKRVLAGFAGVLLSTVLAPIRSVVLDVVGIMEKVGALEFGTAVKIRAGLRDPTKFFDIADAPGGASTGATGAQLGTRTGPSSLLQSNSAAKERERAINKDLASLGQFPKQEIVIENKIENKIEIGGKAVATASGQARAEHRERTGGVTNPFQSGQVLQHGALPQGSF